jgi:hypothetical protein
MTTPAATRYRIECCLDRVTELIDGIAVLDDPETFGDADRALARMAIKSGEALRASLLELRAKHTTNKNRVP